MCVDERLFSVSERYMYSARTLLCYTLFLSEFIRNRISSSYQTESNTTEKHDHNALGISILVMGRTAKRADGEGAAADEAVSFADPLVCPSATLERSAQAAASSSSLSHSDEVASEGIRQSPRGDSDASLTLGALGTHERLNCEARCQNRGASKETDRNETQRDNSKTQQSAKIMAPD